MQNTSVSDSTLLDLEQGRLLKTLKRRFYSHVEREPTKQGCLLWKAYRDKDGYGTFRVGPEKQQAHRVAWMLEHGEIPSSLLIIHSCDNPPCVNIDHLRVGNHLANRRDMLQRHRENPPQGERNYGAKLTAEQIKQIKYLLSLGIKQQPIANEFNICKAHVGQIGRGIRWKHL